MDDTRSSTAWPSAAGKPTERTTASTTDGFRPRSLALALEPRILFDGAAASAVDQHHSDPAPADGGARHVATAEARDVAAPAPAPAPPTLVVIDSRVEHQDQLLAGLPANTKVLVIDPGQDALAAISATLAALGKVDSIQIFSHGAAGQFTLGNQTFTADTLSHMSALLGSWKGELDDGADILLYGCNIGAGDAGRALVDALARDTGAGVAASSDNTGSASQGGNWTLEVTSGVIDRSIALSSAALAGFDGLLANASPTTSLPSGSGTASLLGDSVTFTVDLANTSSQVGYAPFVDLFMPATGKDGDDGVTFVSATYLGQPLMAHVVTFDASGNATHPLARDASGNPLVINAASFGMRPGDQLVVLELPYASISSNQPTLSIQVNARLSDLADTSASNGSPDLTIKVRGGFQYGNDALDNPTIDPTLFEAGTHDFVVHPTLFTLTQTVNMPEGETATGPNYVHSETVTVTPAPGQTLTNFVVTQDLPVNVQVTAITPGPGGTLSSITLQDGSVVTNPALIATLIASDSVFIRSYTVTYASVSAPVDTVVSFYVPETDGTGAPVINSSTGDDVTITFGTASATGRWVPLDPRDITPPATDIDVTGTGNGQGTTFVAKSITLEKQATLQTDVGSPGLTPGDTLAYQLNIAISDYFAFGQNFFASGSFVVVDKLGDGQVLSGPATLTFTAAGVTRTIALVTTTTSNADGTTTLSFDIARSLQNSGLLLGALVGDLAFEQTQSGATTAVIRYNAVIGQSYATPYAQSELNEGDAVGNNATVTGTLLIDGINLTGYDQSDGSTTTTTIPTSTVDIALLTVNGGTPPASGELRPGDVVTFRLSYDLVTGDYEQFKLTAYLPLPLLDVSGTTWSQGSGVGQWTLGAGNTNPDAIDSVTAGAGNSVIFNFGSYATASTSGSRIEVLFTVRVGDQPYADQRTLDVLAQSSQVTTIQHTPLVSSDVAEIVSIAEPVLSITHGVVSSSNGTVSGTTGTWGAPGSGGVPFTGSVTDLRAVDGNVTGIDAGDTLRLATAIENTGGGGAYDVVTSVTLPAGLSFVGGSLAAANLHIYRGDGTALVAGVDYAVSGNDITFLDNGNAATLLAGRAGSAADASGANIVVITYDVTVSQNVSASQTMQSTATLVNYASVEGGADFTPTDQTDVAGEQVAAPAVSVVFAGGTLDDGDSSAPQTSGADLVVGESMLYDVVVTLPEGGTQNLRVDDLIPAGMRLDTSFNGGQGYRLILTTAGSAALGADFNGSVTVSGLTGTGGNLGDNGAGARLTFSAASVVGDNVAGNNSFVVRLRLVASNVATNQAGTTLQDSAQIVYSDPDGDTPNGSVAVDRTVALSGAQPAVVVREPTLQLSQTTLTNPGLGVDEGDTVTYIITIRNGAASSDFNAYDIGFSDTLPTSLQGLTLGSVSFAGGATANGGPTFVLVNGQLSTAAGANIDIPTGGSIEIRVSGVVKAGAASQPSFDNKASVQWTSLDGADAGERTGTDGTLNSGVLNDYRVDNTLTVPVAQAVLISRVGGLPDTPAAFPTSTPVESVAVGEVVRYRVVAVLAEGTTNDYTVQVTLQNGLQFQNDGTVRIVFISNGGITTDITDLVTSGTLNATGDQNSGQAQPISADLSGASPTGALNGAYITVATDANGNQVVTFHLGTLTNRDADPNREGISLEFNAKVLNQASNVAGTALSVSAADFSGSTRLSGSQAVQESIVEPHFTAMDKQVIGFVPGPANTLGTAQVAVSFTQDGSLPAYDVKLTDGFTGGTNYRFDHLVIDGVTYTTAAELNSVGVTVTTTGGLTVSFARLQQGAQVIVFYAVDAPNAAAIAPSAATLTWTSLPDSFTAWGGSRVGAAGASDGERTGSGSGPNTYVLASSAGLGFISGTLWDDTASADSSAVPDGPGLGGQTVTLTWAGLDGNLATTGDNLVYTAITDANGRYSFGVLPEGVYRIDTPTGLVTYAEPLGSLRVRIDTDGGTLGQVGISLADGGTASANAGYVEQNDAPVNTVPGPQAGLEDVPLALAPLAIADVDAGNGIMQVTLTVAHGTLSLSSATPGVTPSGQNSRSLVLQGTLADLNIALGKLVYLGDANYNGADTLVMLTNDQGNFGDADGNGIPGQNPGDALTAQSTVQINLAAVNDAPVGVDDTASATEAGGTNNGTPGINPTGNVLTNDTDVDIATNADRLRVISGAAAGGTQLILPDIGARDIVGRYGTLTLSATGGYVYTVDNANPDVQALRLSGQTLTEQFTYTLSDLANSTATATLTVTIHGANDTPVGVNDVGTATEAGGVLNGTAGSDATGNVLTNDTDPDSAANGETKQVTGIRATREIQEGLLTPVAAGTGSANGTVIAGLYGTLTIGADGTYRYVVDNSNPAVQRLVPGDAPLSDYFSYQVTDAGGLSSLAGLRIDINGANDNPVASDDQATATAGSPSLGTPAANPRGNVILDASRPGTPDQPGGNGIDSDVDHTDQPNTNLLVNGVRPGTEAAGGALSIVLAGGTASVTGNFGTLLIGSDGSYTYTVDSNSAAVQALAPGQTATEVFTYRIVDASGLTDQAQLVITVVGVNDAPVARDDTGQAVEAGGAGNQTPGSDATGDVLSQDTDPDRDRLTVVGVRTGTETGSGTSGTIGTALAGLHGTLTLNADGTYRYVVNNDDAAVQALRTAANQISDVFTYTISDGKGGTDTAQLTIVISGQNDNPVAKDDSAAATEAGGTLNGLPGVDPTGNVLTNDTDVDSAANGETRTVDAVRTGAKTGTGTAGTLGTELRGNYGWLTLSADGNYTYRVDNTLAAVQALKPGDTLSDVFTYRMHDTAGATDTAELQVTVNGAWDAPVANNDVALAVASNVITPGAGNALNPSGNVLINDTDVDQGDQLTVTGIGRGGEASNPALVPVQAGTSNANGATGLRGTYGTLLIGADGTYTYTIDPLNAAVIALGPLEIVTDVFTYQVSDRGTLTDLAQLTVVIRGRNNAPAAGPDAATAVEASGIQNATPGVDPGGNVLANDADPDGDTLVVSGIRTGTRQGSGDSGAVGTALQGQYGALTLNADGTWHYVLDNSLAAVQALRVSGQTLQDLFTYTVRDVYGSTDTAQLTITIDGRNDTPVAHDDGAVAIEAGGVRNGTPGVDPTGNVLDNDTDVDSAANGETKQVVTFGNEAGDSASAGAALAGRYGQLTLNADGTYRYVLDNNNGSVQALLASSTPLSEVFTYRMRDAAGAVSDARLTIQIQGRNDAPVAQDDSNVASDQTPLPQASGNVLPNDTDVDRGDRITVVGVRAGEEGGSGAAGTPGQPLAGKYGTLTLNADGSYTYRMDLSNPTVLAAAGLGQVLQDVFTYTIGDVAGATDQAQLVIHLDVSAPYIQPAGPHFDTADADRAGQVALPDVRPAVFVTPVVETEADVLEVSQWNADGSRIDWVAQPRIRSASIGAGLGLVQGQFVGAAVRDSQAQSDLDLAWILGRHGRIDLSADGLLGSPSLFAPDPASLGWDAPKEEPAPPDRGAASGFNEQLHAAARRLHPLGRLPGIGESPQGLASKPQTER